MKYGYIFVEGQQDVLFLGRLLQELGQKDVKKIENVPKLWSPFVKTERLEEHQGRLANKKPGLPIHELFDGVCFLSQSHSIVIRKVGGNKDAFRKAMDAVNSQLNGRLTSLDAVGIFPDADNDPVGRLQGCKDALISLGLPVANNNGEVRAGSPNTGILVLPGGTDNGGLEEILIDCAESVYPELLNRARQFVEGVDRNSPDFAAEDMKELNTPQGPVKAIVGCVSSILKPGSTIQVSVLRDRWVSANSILQPRVAAIQTFLKELCGIE